MKKFTALFLLLAMLIATLAGCISNKPDPTGTVNADSSLTAAKNYIQTMYRDKAGKVLRDFKVVSVVKIGDETFDVTWTTDAAAENVAIGAPADNVVLIDVNENPGEQDLVFKLTATVTSGDKSESVSFEYYVPGTPIKTSGPVFVEAPAAGNTYKFALVQAELGKTLFFSGTMSGNYLATTDDALEAVDVTIEETDGGVRFYFMDGETKTYIDINEYAVGKAGVRLTTEPTAVFVWNEESKVYTANVAGADRYLGTYNNYNTMSASDIKYITGENASKVGVSQFPAGFCTMVYDIKKTEGALTAGSSYKFFLDQNELGKTLYFSGTMSGNYLATTENPIAATDVTVEEVDGGVRFYFMDGETKTYIDINEYAAGKAGVRLTTEPTAVFVWNDESKVYTANVAGADRYLGTYNNYNTMSASDIKYITGENASKVGVSQFPASFCTINFTFTPNEDAAVAGSGYVFALVQAELGKTLYFNGTMSGNYLATTENAAAAVKVTVEEVEGGVRFYFMDGETKTYIDINEYAAGKAGVRLTTEPTAVFVWNEESKVYTANVAGADRYLGTYNNYNTMSASDIKYITGENASKVGVSQFPACFGTVAP